MKLGSSARVSWSFVGWLALLPTPLAAAQSHKISGELAHLPASLGGDVREVRFSPDGDWLVYLADQDQAGAVDLYSAPADGSAPAVRLSAAGTGPNESVWNFQLTAERAVFQGPYRGLSTAPLDGSAPAVVLTQACFAFAVHPDGARVLWLEGTQSPPSTRVYVAPIDGSAPPTLLATTGLALLGNLALSPDGAWAVLYGARVFAFDLTGGLGLIQLASTGVMGLELTPDSSRAVFSERSGSYPEFQITLFSAPVDGSAAAVALSDTLPSDKLHFAVSPNSDRAVFGLDYTVDGKGEIYSVPVDGSAAPVRLNGTLVAGGMVQTAQPGKAPFQITPDGARVVYRAYQLSLAHAELFAAPIAGGFAPRISGSMVAGGSVSDFQVSPDSVGVVFRADRITNNVIELFGVPFGGGVFPLSAPLVFNGGVLDFHISADDLSVVYRANLEFAARDELFRVAITGGPSTKLNGALASGGDVRSSWVVSPDSNRVAYVADELTDQIDEAFTTPITTSAPVRVNDTLDAGPPAGDVTNYALLPGANAAVYLADEDADDVTELYRADLAGGGVTKLSAPLVSGGDVVDLRVAPDGVRVVYVADAEVDDRRELYSVLADGSQAPVHLNQTLSGSQYVLFPEFTRDSTRVLYFVYNGSVGGTEARLFSVPAAGGTPVQLSVAAQTTTLNLDSNLRISADGSRVVYRTHTDIYSAPVDGSQPPVKLNGRFGPGHGTPNFGAILVRSYEISPDGSRVVYVSDPAAAERWELFSVRMDGGGGIRSSVRLSAPLPPGGRLLQFAISADGARVVYCADQEVVGRFELYSVPIDGAPHFERASGPRRGWLKLNGPLAPGSHIGSACCSDDAFVLSPDGSRVVFMTQPGSDALPESLFTSSIEGGDLTLLASAGSIEILGFSPGGERVLYRNGSTASGIYSARVDASEPPVRLTQALSSNSGPYVISPDGKWVVYRADAQVSDRFEVFARPIDGSQPALRLNAPMTPNGDVFGFSSGGSYPALQVTADSAFVVFDADLDDDEVLELFASPLPALP